MKSLLNKEDRIQIALGTRKLVRIDIEKNIGTLYEKEFQNIVSVQLAMKIVQLAGERRGKPGIGSMVVGVYKLFKKKVDVAGDVRFMCWVGSYVPIILDKAGDYYEPVDY